MTDKELRKLNRSDLLELLVAMSKENEKLRKKASAMKKQLDDRKLAFEESGSIAEAALKVNGVFEAAQAAADHYLENLKQREEHCRDIEEREAQILADAREKADDIIEDAKEQAEEILGHKKHSRFRK